MSDGREKITLPINESMKVSMVTNHRNYLQLPYTNNYLLKDMSSYTKSPGRSEKQKMSAVMNNGKVMPPRCFTGSII